MIYFWPVKHTLVWNWEEQKHEREVRNDENKQENKGGFLDGTKNEEKLIWMKTGQQKKILNYKIYDAHELKESSDGWHFVLVRHGASVCRKLLLLQQPNPPACPAAGIGLHVKVFKSSSKIVIVCV